MTAVCMLKNVYYHIMLHLDYYFLPDDAMGVTGLGIVESVIATVGVLVRL